MSRDQAGLTASERSIRPGILLTAGRATAFAVTFAMTPVLARVFTLAEFGTYKQLILMYTTVVVIAQLGMADSLLYFLPSAPRGGGRYILHALLVLIGSGLVCLAVFILGGPLLARGFENAALLPLSRLLAVSVLLTLPATILEIVLTARKRYAGAGLAYGVSDLARAVALVIPALITRRLEWLLIGLIAFGGIRLGTTLWYCAREFRGALVLDRAELRRQIGYALPLQLGVALWILVQNLHYYIVAAGVDASTYAIYAVGCLQVPIFDMVSTPARNLLTVGMREALTADRPQAALQLWHDTTRRLAMVFFPLVGMFFATAHELIPVLFTDRYAASVPIFMVWSTIGLMLALQADGVLAGYAATGTIARLRAAQLLLTAGLVLFLMRPFGLIGAVQGTVLAIGIGTALGLRRAARLLRVPLADLLPWRRLGGILGGAAVSALGAMLVKAQLDAPPPLLVVYTSAAFTAIYLAILAGQAGGRGALLRAAKEVAAAGLVLSGLARLTTALNRRKSLVLLYHGVHDGALDPVVNLDGLHVRAARFERQMRYVASHYHVVPLDHLLEPRQRAGGKPLAAITFDDGYGNLYANAYPVLKRLGLPATVFVIADFLRGRRAPWWDRLAAMVAASRQPEVGMPIGGTERRFPLRTVEQKQTTLRTLFRELLALPPAQRETMLDRLGQALGVGDRTLETPTALTVEQLREMAGGGITVGAHGCSHDSFLHLDGEQLTAELMESRFVLESLTGCPVHWLAYPHGAFSRETVEVARKVGYRGALTAIDEGLNDAVRDPFAIRRIGVGEGSSFARFIVAISGLRDTLKALLGMERRDEPRTAPVRRAAVSGSGMVLSTRTADEVDLAD